MLAPSDDAALAAVNGKGIGKPRLTAGVFLLGDPTTTCCGFVNQASARLPDGSWGSLYEALPHNSEFWDGSPGKKSPPFAL